ncbi:hypothetical protein ACTA71_011486 [Dictyostelium dimigraforme]
MKTIFKNIIIIILLINEIIGFEFNNLNSIKINNNNNNNNNNDINKIQCNENSLYPYDLPVLIYIVSLIKSSNDNFNNYNDNNNNNNNKIELNKLLTATVNGRTCLSEGIDNNLIFELSIGSNVIVPQQLLEKQFDAKYININFRGEILSFPDLSILIKHNNITDSYHIETIFKN